MRSVSVENMDEVEGVARRIITRQRISRFDKRANPLNIDKLVLRQSLLTAQGVIMEKGEEKEL